MIGFTATPAEDRKKPLLAPPFGRAAKRVRRGYNADDHQVLREEDWSPQLRDQVALDRQLKLAFPFPKTVDEGEEEDRLSDWEQQVEAKREADEREADFVPEALKALMWLGAVLVGGLGLIRWVTR